MFYQDLGYNKLLNKNVFEPPLNSAVIDSEIESGAIDLDKTNINRLFKTGRAGYLEIDNKTQNAPFIRVYTKENGLKDTKVILGNLKDKTGTEEYGVWIKSGAAYIGGYRLYEAVVDAGGDGDYENLHDAIADGKKRLFIRNGTYQFTSDLTLPEGAVLIGETRDGVVLNLTTDINNYNSIICDNDYITITNLTIGSDSPEVTINAIKGSGNNILIYKVKFTYGPTYQTGPYYAINLSGDDVTIHNCDILCLRKCQLDGSRTYFYNNYFHDKTGNYCCILEFGGNKQTIVHNYIEQLGTHASNSAAINCIGDGTIITENTIITNLTSDNGIAAQNEQGEFVRINNNYIKGYEKGIFISNQHGAIVTNNICYQQGGWGIYLDTENSSDYSSGYNIVSNNLVYDSSDIGFFVSGTNTILSGNIAAECTSHGFYNDSRITFVTFENNVAVNNGDCGFSFWPSSTYDIEYCIFIGNKAVGNGDIGFKIKDGPTVIVGNIAYSNTNGGSSLNNDPQSEIGYNIGF